MQSEGNGRGEFREIFVRHLREQPSRPAALPPGACRSSSSHLCPLCHAARVDYDQEARARNTALREYWRTAGTRIALEPLVLSPRGRAYRTVSKRKAFEFKGEVRLGLISSTEGAGRRPVDVTLCMIEPPDHAVIYARVQESLLAPFARPLAAAIRYVIVKGNYSELTLIFNVSAIEGPLLRAANALSKMVTASCPAVRGVFLYEDTSQGGYYLGMRNPPARGAVRKIFGKGEIYQRFGGHGFLFPALSFSQVNASLVDTLIAEAGRMLALSPASAFFDLYCGYGLFTLTCGTAAGRSTGIERSPESIDAASANAARQRAAHVRFIRCNITPGTLSPLIAHLRPEDAVLLDPPRSGTAPGVIECIAARRPGRVVHMFCDIDVMRGELARWRDARYEVTRAVPFDMFPGTDEVEIMARMEKR